MQTPMKIALAALAAVAFIAPTTVQAGNPSLHANGTFLLGTRNVSLIADSCIDPANQGTTSTCFDIWPSEADKNFTLVANGMRLPLNLWTKKASDLGVAITFYDALLVPLGTANTYVTTGGRGCSPDYPTAADGDVIGVVPAGTRYAVVGATALSAEVSWWFMTAGDECNTF